MAGSSVALGGSTLTLNGVGNTTFAGDIAGTGGLVKNGAGVQTLSGNNTFSGSVALNAGGLALGSSNALGSSVLTVGGDASLDSTSAQTLTNSVQLANGTLTLVGSNALTLNGQISGAGGLMKDGAATVTLGGSNGYTGTTTINSGTLAVAAGGSLSGVSTVDLAGAGTLDISAGGNQSIAGLAGVTGSSVVLGGAMLTTGGNNASTTFAGVLGGTGGLVQSGTGTLTLTGTNTYTGGTTINTGGTLQIGNGGTEGTLGAGAVTNNGTLTVNRSGTLTLSQNISGTGGLSQLGPGTTVLTGNNSYTGAIQIVAGTLQAGSATALTQNSAYVIGQGATLDLNGHALQTSQLSVAGHLLLGAADLTVNTAAGQTDQLSGQISGAGHLVKQGQGTLALNGANSFTSGVDFKQGVISLGNEKGLGQGTLSMDDGTRIVLSANNMTIANHLHMTGTNDPIIDTGANNGTWAGDITGAGFLTKQGTGQLTLTSAGNTYTGPTDVAQGTLQAGASNTFSSASVHAVAAGSMLDLAGYNQTLASLNNSGVVKLSSNTGATPGTVLKVTGAYVGNGGTLGISTVLGADGSASDKLLLSGASAVASGNTTIQITNTAGLGARTTGSGIQIIATENGGSLQPGSFALAGGHVDAGVYEYHLTQTSEGAALHSTNNQTPTNPTTAYRVEAPLVSALPAQLRQADMAMLGDLRKRMGDEGTQATTSSDTGASRRVWGRILRTDPSIRQQGTVSPESRGHLTGFQTGLDLYAGQSIKAGIYVGQLEGDMSVTGFASGIERKYVGFNNLRTRYLGLYGAWQDDSGLYADAVLQGSDYRSDLRTAGDTAQARTKGSGWLASLEVGKPFAINSNWQIEPQAQLTYRKLSIDDTALSLATVKTKADDDWTLRLGARIKGSFTTSAGVLQPYGRINIYKASNTTDTASFITPAASTDIQAKGGYTATEMAAGASLQISNRTSVYGELGKLWSNGGDSRVKSGVQASIGVKVQW